MKIRTQYNLTLVVFGAILFIILASMVATHLKIERLQKQADLVTKIEKNIRDITYLSNEYLVYHESQHLRRWESQYSSISTFLENLQVDSQDKKGLLDHIKTNFQRVKEVFADTVSTLDNASLIQDDQAHAALVRTLWSRMGVQNQEMAFAASGLLRLINNEESRLNQINTVLIICLLGACGICIGASNYLIYKRTLKSISLFQAGTKIIGAGNLEYSIEEINDDEIGELCCDFNEMTRKLGRSYNNLENEIAERKRVEEAMRESEARYHSLFENMLHGFAFCRMLFDDHGRPSDFVYLDVNRAFGRLTGLEEVTGKKVTEVIPGIKESDPELLEIYGRIAMTGQAEKFEIEVESLGIWFSISAYSPERGYFVAVFDNITERKQAESALRDSERLYRAIGESIDYGVWVCAPDGRCTYASESFLGMVGMTQEQCSNFGWGDILHPDDAENTVSAWKECVRSEGVWDIEHRFLGTDGQWHAVLARGVPVRNDSGEVIFWAGINLDISRMKQAENELRASEEKFSTMLQTVPIAIALATLPDGALYNVNPAWLDLTGIARKEDAIGKTSLELGLIGDAAQREGILNEFRQNGFARNVELAFCSRKGVQHTVLVNLDRVEIGGRAFILSTMEDITERKRAEEELQKAKDNLEGRVRERTAELLTAMDTLSGEMAERKLVEDELQDANSTLRRLLRTIAHEFRTPLGLLTGSTDILDRYWDRLTAEKRQEQNAQIQNAAYQISSLVNSVTSFQMSEADRHANPLQLLDFRDICSSIATEVETVWSSGHEYVVSIAADCGSALIDEILFRRILQNLLSNAFRYTPTNGTVSLHVLREKNTLVLEVTDTGIGIPVEEQALIFDAFYRSQNVEGRRGLGLGLSIVREALSQIGGTITVNSRMGVGTTMRVEIPVADSV